MTHDHTRKYNDWDIKKPESARPIGKHNPQSAPSAQEGDQQDTEKEMRDSFEDPVRQSQSAEVPTDVTNDQAPTAMPDMGQPPVEPNVQSQTHSDVDPATGLPIPDYLKPYTQESEDN